MGCDIHLYPEGRISKDHWYSVEADEVPRTCAWQSNGPRFDIGRAYGLFAALAGVRGGPAVFEPRGFPADAANAARRDYHRVIMSGEEKALWLRRGFNSEVLPTCKPEQAERWVKRGASERTEHGTVTCPDWHTPSWLSLAEMKQVHAICVERSGNPDAPALVRFKGLMDCLKTRRGDTRIVFWFDN